MPLDTSRPHASRSAGRSVRAIIRMFEGEDTPVATSPPPGTAAVKFRSFSTPVPGARKDLESVIDKKVPTDQDTRTASRQGGCRGMGRRPDVGNGGAASIDGKDEAKNLQLVGGPSECTARSQGGTDYTAQDPEPSTPRIQPTRAKSPQDTEVVFSPLNSPNAPSLPTSLTTLLADSQIDPEPLPLTPHDPTAAAF